MFTYTFSIFESYLISYPQLMVVCVCSYQHYVIHYFIMVCIQYDDMHNKVTVYEKYNLFFAFIWFSFYAIIIVRRYTIHNLITFIHFSFCYFPFNSIQTIPCKSAIANMVINEYVPRDIRFSKENINSDWITSLSYYDFLQTN